MSERTGILLLTFGSAVTSEDVPRYLASVRGGRPVSDELITEFRRRFDVIGRSPLLEITREQAAGLQSRLDSETPGAYMVREGYLHSAPSVADAHAAVCSEGVTRILAIVLAPQYSSLILTGYEKTLATLEDGPPLRTARAWHDLEAWVGSLCERVSEALHDLPSDVPVVFTAHSLPRIVVDRDPAYIEQLHATVDAVAARSGIVEKRWHFAWQSAGHTPEEWLKPDLTDLLPQLAAEGCDELLVVPVQFVADHLETLYDIDVAAAAQADAAGMRMHRIAMPNASPRFVDALAAVVHRELAAWSS